LASLSVSVLGLQSILSTWCCAQESSAPYGAFNAECFRRRHVCMHMHRTVVACLQVKRIGKYKSAGDQLLRKDMSDPQREQLSALLDGLYDYFLSHVAKACCCCCCCCLHAVSCSIESLISCMAVHTTVSGFSFKTTCAAVMSSTLIRTSGC
jgi:hypothetical protein